MSIFGLTIGQMCVDSRKKDNKVEKKNQSIHLKIFRMKNKIFRLKMLQTKINLKMCL